MIWITRSGRSCLIEDYFVTITPDYRASIEIATSGRDVSFTQNLSLIDGYSLLNAISVASGSASADTSTINLDEPFSSSGFSRI